MDNIATHIDADGIERRSFVSLNVAGWHRHGTVVNKSLKDPEALSLSGLDWTAEALSLYRSDMEPITSHKVIIRSDDKRQLGIVGKGYKTLQNRDLFAWFREVAGIKEMVLETAGALGEGETVWALARIPGIELRKGEDFSQGYMLISNAHDGSAAVTIRPTTIRVVCQNTLAMATAGMRGKGTVQNGWKVRHTSGMSVALADIADAYARTMADYETTRAAFSALTGRPLTKEGFDKMMAAAFAKSAEALVEAPDEKGRAQSIAKNRAEKVQSILYSPTCTVQGTAGTLWAGLQAITQYVDHESTTRVTGDASADFQRFASAQFGGAGERAKAKAYEAALALV